MSTSDEMPRTEGTAPKVIDHVHGLTEAATPVWVRLDALYIRDPGTLSVRLM